MKILHVYKHAAPDVYGGIEFVIDKLAKAQIDDGHEVHVLATSKNGLEGNFDYNGYKLTLTKNLFSIASTPFSLSFMWRLFKLANETNIIHIHFPYPFADICMLLAKKKCKVIVTYHSDIIRQNLLKIIYFPIQAIFFRQVDRIIATSPNYMSTSKTLQRFKTKTDVIPLGADDIYQPEPPTYSKPFEGDYFIFVGEFRYYKGLHTLIEAADQVTADIIIIGAGPLERDLSQIVTKKKLSNVHFVGRVDDEEKHQYFQHAIAVVFPSNLRSEAFGVTLVEGAMHGLPLISCEIGTGTSYVNIHNETGIVCPPNDPTKLANAMNEIYENKALARNLGRKARQRFAKKFTSHNMAEAYKTIYKQLIFDRLNENSEKN